MNKYIEYGKITEDESKKVYMKDLLNNTDSNELMKDNLKSQAGNIGKAKASSTRNADKIEAFLNNEDDGKYLIRESGKIDVTLEIDAEKAVLQMGKLVRLICKKIYMENINSNSKNLCISDYIEVFEDYDLLDAEILDSFRTIQMYSEDEKHLDEGYSEIPEEYVELCSDSMFDIVQWYMSDYKNRQKKVLEDSNTNTDDKAELEDNELIYLIDGINETIDAKVENAYEEKSAEELFELGQDYYFGIGGKEKDLEEAVKYYIKAGEKGHVKAQYELGDCYYLGRGVKKDLEEAVKWYKKAADKGHAEAQYELGNCYYLAIGVEEDLEEAVKWYGKAAEQGNDDAQYKLGNFYWNGKGVEKNEFEAIKWYEKSAKQGNKRASEIFEEFKKNEKLFESYRELQEREEKVLKNVVEVYHKYAEEGNSAAQKNLGQCYELGIGVEKDLEEALKWYRKSAEQGNEDARKKVELLTK